MNKREATTKTRGTKHLQNGEYQCAVCKDIFKTDWSDIEAKQEAEDIFGLPVEEWEGGAVMVCDDCFQKINPI